MLLRTQLIVRTLLLAMLFTALPQFSANATPNIPDPTRTGSLTVSKHYLPDAEKLKTNGMPQEIDPAKNPPIPNVEFTISRVTAFDPGDGSPPWEFSLLSNESWLAAAKITAPQALSDAITTVPVPGGVQRTDSSGHVRFDDLPIGLYLVEETDLPINFDHDGDPATPAQSVLPAMPFLVTIPMTNPVAVDGAARGTTWLYDVYAYPKSSVAMLDKKTNFDELTVGTKVGDPVSFTLAGEIPHRGFDIFGKQQVFKHYEITDVFDDRLEVVPESVHVVIAELPLIQLQSTDYEASIGPDELRVVFTPSGLKKLDSARAGIHRVEVSFFASAVTMGEIPNGGPSDDPGTSATLTIRTGQNSGAGDLRVPDNREVSVHSPEVEVQFGGESLWKHGTDDPSVGLPGAQFRIFASKAAAEAYAADPVTYRDYPLSFYTSKSNPQRVTTIDYSREVQTVTTDLLGHAMIAGLRYGQYWVLETQAPNVANVQYQLLAEPFEITIDSQLDGVLDGDFPDDTVVANAPQNAGFQLPLTGDDGALLPLVLGILILGICLALVLEAHRRRRSV